MAGKRCCEHEKSAARHFPLQKATRDLAQPLCVDTFDSGRSSVTDKAANAMYLQFHSSSEHEKGQCSISSASRALLWPGCLRSNASNASFAFPALSKIT